MPLKRIFQNWRVYQDEKYGNLELENPWKKSRVVQFFNTKNDFMNFFSFFSFFMGLVEVNHEIYMVYGLFLASLRSERRTERYLWRLKVLGNKISHVSSGFLLKDPKNCIRNPILIDLQGNLAPQSTLLPLNLCSSSFAIFMKPYYFYVKFPSKSNTKIQFTP